jgi:integrase
MNPHGYHPFSSATFGKTLRKWVDELPRLDSAVIGPDGNPVLFDRAKICAYSFRHTYAQRHADAGTPPDVLKELMGHEKIETTMGYYNPWELHQMGASPQVACLAGDRNTRTAPTRHAV